MGDSHQTMIYNVARRIEPMVELARQRDLVVFVGDPDAERLQSLFAGVLPQCFNLAESIAAARSARDPIMLALNRFDFSGIVGRFDDAKHIAMLIEKGPPAGSVYIFTTTHNGFVLFVDDKATLVEVANNTEAKP